MSIDTLIAIWGWIYVLGLGAFFAVAVFVIPLGARDVLRLLRPEAEDETGGEGER